MTLRPEPGGQGGREPGVPDSGVEPARPDPARPDPARPEPGHAESARPEPAHAESGLPESGRAESGRAGSGLPEPYEPDLPRTAKVRRGPLRTGWTTGTCAAAAAKAAAAALVTGRTQTAVDIALPSGNRVGFPVERCEVEAGRRAEAVVVKDAGDDPDVTHGAHLTATLRWWDRAGLELEGGVGVGVVTKPGLGLAVGGPAINDTPRRMINSSVAEAVDLERHGVRVVISVPEGERMARKTTNARLGILGGISILGTTGVVRPFSTASWRASVVQAVSVAAAQGERTTVLCTGARTEHGARRLLPELAEVCFVEVGDFTGAALREAEDRGMTGVVFVGMAGKLAKLAAGVLMTHYTRSRVDTGLLARLSRDAGLSRTVAEEVAGANTARHVYEIWQREAALETAGGLLCRRVAGVLDRFCAGRLRVDVAMVDFSGRDLVASSGRWSACR